MPTLYRCLEHNTVRVAGEGCAGFFKGSCQTCGHWGGEHYFAMTLAGDPVDGCSDTESGGPGGEYNLPCSCTGYNGDLTVSFKSCRNVEA